MSARSTCKVLAELSEFCAQLYKEGSLVQSNMISPGMSLQELQGQTAGAQ